MQLTRVLIFLTALVASAGCDHATKQLASTALADSSAVSIAADMVRFELAHNPGGFLSLGAALPDGVRTLFFVGAVPLLLGLFCIVMLRTSTPTARSLIALGLVAGGGVANWLDRLWNGGAVTDFVSLGLGPLRTGIFNFADVSVIVGVGLLLFTRTRPPRSEASAD